MKKSFLALVALCAAASAFAGLATKTNVWTGNAGTYEWSDLGNWQAKGGGDPAAISDYVVWDFSTLPANSTIVNNSATALSVCGLVFGENQGTITFSGSGTGLVKYYVRNGTTDWHDTSVTIPSGTTIDYDVLSKDDDWTQFVIVLKGGGAFKLGSGMRCATTQQFQIYDIDFTVKSNQPANRNKIVRYMLYSDEAVLRFELDHQVGSVTAQKVGIQPRVYLNGHVINQRFLDSSSEYAFKIMDGGTLKFANGSTRALGDVVTSGQAVTLVGVDSDLSTGSSSDNTATAPFAFQSTVNAWLTAYGSQSLTSVSMAGPESAVIAASSGKTVTIGGFAAGTSMIGSLSGLGGFAFDLGVGNSVALDGRTDYSGPTEVKSGTVLTRTTDKVGVRRADHSGLVAYWNFERDDDGAGSKDITDEDPIVLKGSWVGNGAAPAVTNDAPNGAGCSSRYAHFYRPVQDGDNWQSGRYEGLQNNGTMPEKSAAMSNDYTIVLYLRPNPVTMEGGAREHERPNNVMEVFYNAWAAYRMNWVRFVGKQTLRFGGFKDNDYGDQDLTGIPDLFDGAWHQLAWSFTQADRTFRVYIDGVFKKSWTRSSHAFHLSTSSISFGARTQGNWSQGAPSLRQTYDGDMDNIQLWDRALSSDEISDDWARGGVIRRTVESSEKKKPIALWNFDDPTDFGKDTSGNGYHLTQTGTADYLLASDLPGAHECAVKINTGVNFRLATVPEAIQNASNFTVCIKFMPYSTNYSTNPNVFQWCDSAETSGSNVKIYYTSWPAQLTVYADKNNAYWEPDSFADHGSSGFTHGMWENMTITYNKTSGSFRFYRSGILRQAFTVHNTMSNATEFMLGVGLKNPGRGYLDEARFYDQELSADEVCELAREMGTDNAANTALLPPTDLTVGADGTLGVRDDLTVRSLTGAGKITFSEGDLTVTGTMDFTGETSGGGNLRLPDAAAYTVDDTAKIIAKANAPIEIPASGTLNVTGTTYPANRRIVIARGTKVTAPDGIAGWTANLADGGQGKFYLTSTEFGFKVSGGMMLILK